MNGDFFINSVLTQMNGDICFLVELELFCKLGLLVDLSLLPVPIEDVSYFSDDSAWEATTTSLSDGKSILRKQVGYFKAEFCYLGPRMSGWLTAGEAAWEEEAKGDGAWPLLFWFYAASDSSSISKLEAAGLGSFSITKVLNAFSAKTSGRDIC
jgi:hypothetical protein